MNLSLKQYRNIDLGIMLAMLAAAEVLINRAALTRFADELYVLSPTIAVVCIVMMRWGAYAAVHVIGGGLAMCIASGASAGQTTAYCVGGCLSLAAMALFKVWGKDKLRESTPKSLLFTAAAFLAAQVGRWLVGMLFGGTAADIVRLLTTDSLSLLFALVTVQLARKIDGLFEDQVSYLVRTQSERQRQQLAEGGEGTEMF